MFEQNWRRSSRGIYYPDKQGSQIIQPLMCNTLQKQQHEFLTLASKLTLDEVDVALDEVDVVTENVLEVVVWVVLVAVV